MNIEFININESMKSNLSLIKITKNVEIFWDDLYMYIPSPLTAWDLIYNVHPDVWKNCYKIEADEYRTTDKLISLRLFTNE